MGSRRGLGFKLSAMSFTVDAHFLDNVIEVNELPARQDRRAWREATARSVWDHGLGRHAHHAGVAYDSMRRSISARASWGSRGGGARASIKLARVAGHVRRTSKARLFRLTRWGHARNATVTTIAPTGTLSKLSGDSSRGSSLSSRCTSCARSMDNDRLIEVDPAFRRRVNAQGASSRQPWT